MFPKLNFKRVCKADGPALQLVFTPACCATVEWTMGANLAVHMPSRLGCVASALSLRRWSREDDMPCDPRQDSTVHACTALYSCPTILLYPSCTTPILLDQLR